MAVPKLSQDKIERILSAGPDVSIAQLAAELGISEFTVKKYRRQARQEREEVAREVIARHVEENIPDALSDLHDLRQKAREIYFSSADAKDGQLLLAAIKTTLEYVRPDDSALDAAIEAELAGVDPEGQGAVAGKGQGAASGSGYARAPN